MVPDRMVHFQKTTSTGKRVSRIKMTGPVGNCTSLLARLTISSSISFIFHFSLFTATVLTYPKQRVFTTDWEVAIFFILFGLQLYTKSVSVGNQCRMRPPWTGSISFGLYHKLSIFVLLLLYDRFKLQDVLDL